MKITFSGKYAPNPETFGINFEVILDGKSVVCSVSREALQDIDPSSTYTTGEQQFLSNRSSFESIAEEKIRAGAVPPIMISTRDVLA